MTISDSELELVQEEFKILYPFLYDDNDEENYPKFSEDLINRTINYTILDIPSHCRKWKEIYFNMTIHLLITYQKDKDKLLSNDFEIDKNISSIEAIGDISTTFAKNSRYEEFNPLYDSSTWGQRAKLLLKQCAKSRLGLIV